MAKTLEKLSYEDGWAVLALPKDELSQFGGIGNRRIIDGARRTGIFTKHEVMPLSEPLH